MSDGFRSSDDFDEQAHHPHNQGRNDQALETLKAGLAIYPSAAELHIGMGYAYLAREEFAWSRRAFEQALALDRDHEDALAGMGEALLAMGERHLALQTFDRLLALGFQEDHELMLQAGRALFRRGPLEPEDRFDDLGLYRTIELKKTIYRLSDGDPELAPWLARLGELAPKADAIDDLLAEIEARQPDGTVRDPNQLELFGAMLSDLPGMARRHGRSDGHQVATLNGGSFRGTWEEILLQLKDAGHGGAQLSLAEFMSGLAARGREETGVIIPLTDAEAFIRGSADAGVLRIVQ